MSLEKIHESEVVYLLLNKISQFKRYGHVVYEPIQISLKGFDQKDRTFFYLPVEGKSHCKKVSKQEWILSVKKLFPFISEWKISSNKLYPSHQSVKTLKKYKDKDIILKGNLKVINGHSLTFSDMRRFFIEVKGDSKSSRNVSVGLALSSDDIPTDIQQGDNVCLAFPITWYDYVLNRLKEDKSYERKVSIYGRKNNDIFEKRYFFVGRDKILMVNKNLEKSNSEFGKFLRGI